MYKLAVSQAKVTSLWSQAEQMTSSALGAPVQRRTEYLAVSVILAVELGALTLALALNLTLPLRLLIALKAISRRFIPTQAPF